METALGHGDGGLLSDMRGLGSGSGTKYWIDRTLVHRRQLIGSGNFSKVYASRLHGSDVCEKVYEDQPTFHKGHFVKSQINEFCLLHELGPETAARLLSSCVFATHFTLSVRSELVIIMPLMSHGSLSSALAQPNVSSAHMLNWYHQISQSVMELHAQGNNSLVLVVNISPSTSDTGAERRLS